MENQKQGHIALFRSLLSKDWAKDTAKLSMWVRLIGEAAYKPRTVDFSGKTWELMPGQLVTTAAIMGRKLRDQDGNEKSPQAVTRMLNFFAREGMITTKGTRFGTVISITNYGDYQVISADEPSDRPSGNNKPSRSKALKGVPDEPSDRPSGEQNKKLLEQELKDTPKSPEGSLVEQEETKPKKQAASKFTFDRERFQDTWNCKAKKHGLPRITSISISTEKGIKRLYESHLLHCKQTKRSPADIDTFINGYIEFGYEPSPYAMGDNPAGRKYGIDTALTQRIIDKIISQEV
ncbi:replication protein [Rahnella sikkimica]|nr:replication protein [Rahnella sikkimica]